MRLLSSVCFILALLTGLLAALMSQASSSNYHMLFLWVLGFTALCLPCAVVAFFHTNGVARVILAVVVALAVAGCVEFGARLLGVRLLG